MQKIKTKEEEEKFNDFVWSMFNLPKILKAERLYRNLSTEEMAEKIGTEKNIVIACEKGEITDLITIQQYFLTLRGYDIITKSEEQIKNYIQ